MGRARKSFIFLALSVTLSASCAGAHSPIFDAPIAADIVELGPDTVHGDVARKVTCFRYPDFMVKQVDYGEVGAQKLTLQSSDAACSESQTEGRQITDMAGYFLGRKGNYLFFRAADGWNGGMPFYVLDSRTLKLLFEDNYRGTGFFRLEHADGTLTIDFERSYQTPCSLYLDGVYCSQKVKASIQGLQNAALPDCGAVYEAEKQRIPKFAKQIEQLPSVIFHSARLVFDGRTAIVAALPGPMSCRVPD